MENVKELVQEIKAKKTQRGASLKDEVSVMKAMLNDKEYKVTTYDLHGPSGEVCPSAEARGLASSILSTGAGITTAEANEISENYEFKKAEAEKMITIGKEFINTYLPTGRKISFGGREKSNISIMEKEVPESRTKFPKKSINSNGETVYEHPETVVPAHRSIKSSGPCPAWLK